MLEAKRSDQLLKVVQHGDSVHEFQAIFGCLPTDPRANECVVRGLAEIESQMGATGCWFQSGPNGRSRNGFIGYVECPQYETRRKLAYQSTATFNLGTQAVTER